MQQIAATLARRFTTVLLAAMLTFVTAVLPLYPVFAQPAPAPAPAPPAPTAAPPPIPEADDYDISNNITFVGGDPCNLGGLIDQGDSPLPAGADKIEQAFKFLYQRLLYEQSAHPAEQAAGIVGNLLLESGLNPKITNSIGAYGIAQWLGTRKSTLLQRPNHDTLEGQLNYLWWEVTKGPEQNALRVLTTRSSVRGAAIAWEQEFERSGGAGMSARIRYAEEVFDKYGASVAGLGAAGPGATCVPGDGLGLVNAEGYAFPVAPQTKSENGRVTAMSQLPCPNLGIPYCHRGTPAFDISRKPGGDAIVGTPVYAITDGRVYNSGIYLGIRGCYKFHLKSSKDNFDYFYTHTANFQGNGEKKGGNQVAAIGPRRCTGNGSVSHLHIDRGCVQGGQPQPGGYGDCRDPGFVPLMNSIFNALPQ